MIDAPTTTRLPMEYVGRARLLWRRVHEETLVFNAIKQVSMDRCAQIVKKRPGRPFRSDYFFELIDLWRSMPSDFALSPLQVVRTDKRLSLCSTRLLSTTSSHIAWDGANEPQVMVSEIRLDIDRKGAEHSGGPIVSISLHALGRRLLRGFGEFNDAALLSDAAGLLAHFIQTGVCKDRIGEPFVCEIPEVGRWLGRIAGYNTTAADRAFTILACRTFV